MNVLIKNPTCRSSFYEWKRLFPAKKAGRINGIGRLRNGRKKKSRPSRTVTIVTITPPPPPPPPSDCQGGHL